MKSTYSEAGMQDASLRVNGTRVIELPVISRFGIRASKGISWEGTFFFSASRDTEDLLKTRARCEAQVIFISRDANLGSIGEGSEPGNHSPSCLWHICLPYRGREAH